MHRPRRREQKQPEDDGIGRDAWSSRPIKAGDAMPRRSHEMRPVH